MAKKIEMVGKRFGRWTVLAEADKNKSGHYMWLCRCDCGTETAVNGSNLRRGLSSNCGCKRIEIATKLLTERNRTHGMTKTRLYNTYRAILKRCNNPRCAAYRYYGGRGITNHFESFEIFADWSFSNGYSEGLTIDRIDNDKGYSPQNCRWATPFEQSRNTRRNKFITNKLTGEKLCYADWSYRLGGDRHLVSQRVNNWGWDEQKAITTPSQAPGRSASIF